MSEIKRTTEQVNLDNLEEFYNHIEKDKVHLEVQGAVVK